MTHSINWTITPLRSVTSKWLSPLGSSAAAW
jgi:hypothetical protein